ncbi:MAG: prepilin-type N-terminal cleavage/methylation domain-containing protein [Candidatus Eremiobacteraeota bacterium]|nr:prepilin-type N-terminal cleavage/methylation domain-containing protein [Candidatus Eremiobacteraeota bacterium]
MSRDRGLTLVETLVVCGLFALLLTMVVVIETTQRRAQQQQAAVSGNYRAAMVAVEHLRAELQNARLVLAEGDLEANRLRYLRPRLLDGEVVVGQGGLAFEDTPRTIELRGASLVRTNPDRKLAELGPSGGFELAVQGASGRLLRVTIRAGRESSGQPYEALLDLRLRD